jgi:ribosomal protein S18 acetylase RimI-like enzyme
MESAPPTQVIVRSFRPADLPGCQVLYRDGLLGGKLAENDTGLDIDDIEQAYMSSPGSHFWVAQAQDTGELVGMIGIQQHEAGMGEIRRLRVRQDMRRRGVGSKLLQAALEFCRENNILKVTLDTFIDREPALGLFQKFNFRHERTREAHGKQLLYFYLDLYGGARRSE